MTPAPAVVVVATGGTIASRPSAEGGTAPALGGDAITASAGASAPVRVVDLMAEDSAALDLARMQEIADAVADALADPHTTGVVVLHGTDSLEETALLVGLQCGADPRPIVLTGAQFLPDDPRSDGPANVAAALAIASGEAAAPRHPATGGAVIVFGGRVLPAWGASKARTDDADAFRRSGDASGAPVLAAPALAAPALATARRAHDGVARVRVDVVAVVPGGDDLHLRASAAAGARAVVLEALGSGNASPAIVEGVRRCVDQGVRVAVTSRVPEGALAATYGGGGGGHDLVVAGAAMARTLRAGQARILLAELLARGMADDAIAAALAA
ncbi:L-asparaginase [Microbacterium barkeri]|uniref:asparaginase n=1 Tax=Microbacterium barkeri TaxID=33917 RepID=A0A9W6H618_9MICO|nr:asparaginase domain-containing protein [Microbacterium barkeri]MDR6876823.1 L-asparaginase [Microbacterium barkeri]GLJ62804.1 L-asparaginase [Microbacterium barkeri]